MRKTSTTSSSSSKKSKQQQQMPETKTTKRKLQRNLLKTLGSCEKTKTNCYNYLNKYRITIDEFLKWRICTGITILSSFLSFVKANSTSIASTFEATEYGDELVICLPTNSNSCITYVNSPLNGLIELNETIYPGLKVFNGSYDYKMIARINPFWLKFEPPSDTSYFVMGVLYMIIFFFGVTGNGLVIYMFARCKALRTASYILVFNLAVSDIMIVIKCPMAAYNNFMHGPALGDWGCRIFGFIGGFSGTASIGMLTITSLDRYSVVVNPLSPLRLNYNTKYYYFLLAVVWLDSLLFSVIPLCEVGLSTYVPEGYLTTCSFDYLDKSMNARIFMFVFFVVAWLIPLAIICYCYFHILKAVFTSKNIQSNKNKHQVEVRLALIVLLVIGLWFLAWTPYAVVAMAGVFGQEEYLTPTRSMIPALFCKTASCLNPFLYTISHKRFRNELQRLFLKRPPIYRYSITRSSCVTRSTRRTRNRVDMYQDDDIDGVGVGIVNQSVYKMELNEHRTKIKSKLSIESIESSFVANANRNNSQRLKKNNKVFKQRSKSLVLPDKDKGIFVLDINMANAVSCRQLEQLETDF